MYVGLRKKKKGRGVDDDPPAGIRSQDARCTWGWNPCTTRLRYIHAIFFYIWRDASNFHEVCRGVLPHNSHDSRFGMDFLGTSKVGCECWSLKGRSLKNVAANLREANAMNFVARASCMEGFKKVFTRHKTPNGADTGSPSGQKFDLGYPPGFEEKYELLKKIGKGAQGKVYRCRCKESGKMFAVKVVKKKLFAKDSVFMQLFQKEVKILQTLKGCTNMCNMIDIFEDRKKLYLVQDLCEGGELFKQIRKKVKKGYTEAAAANIVRQMLKFVAEIHLRGIAHRDIKPQNFIFKDLAGSEICAVDFGLGDFFEKGKPMRGKVGSALYVAPEILFGEGYGPEVDVWSVGVVMYLMLCGCPPFKGATDTETLFEVMGADLSFSFDPWYTISDSAKDLVMKLLDRSQESRITASQALSHEWLKEGGAPPTALDFSVIHRMENFARCCGARRLLMSQVARRLDPESLAFLRDQFILMDTDNDGLVSMSDLEHAICQLRSGEGGDRVIPYEKVEEIFMNIDLDQSGGVDYWEFIASVVNWQQLSGNPAITKDLRKCALDVFKTIDLDGNGFVDPNEIEMFVGGGEDAAEIVAEVARNRDGHVNFRQFCRVLHHKRRSINGLECGP
ncbi:hypothetical protein BSKO_08329 [Bryopsis sp. KO-2023]|nr:hypothetical protein BSKO_08329 [Bryopsis sp. KO-2023]